MHYRASWSSFSSIQIKWWAAIYYWLTDKLCRSAAYFRFVSAFCFTCNRRWNKTEIKQSRLKQTWNKFVLFQFYFSFISHVRAALGLRRARIQKARLGARVGWEGVVSGQERTPRTNRIVFNLGPAGSILHSFCIMSTPTTKMMVRIWGQDRVHTRVNWLFLTYYTATNP